MDTIRFFKTCVHLGWGRLRRQCWLLAGLALLCLLLPLAAGRAAGQLLRQKAAVGQITLAIAAPAGDETAALLEQYLGGMEDIAQYCRIAAMEEQQALDALADGSATAVLALPERFVQRVMQGENPDLRLIVSGSQPLESLLLLWVGQGAADLLSAVQGGVYAVLDLYEQSPPPGLSREQVVQGINLRYLLLTLNRSGFFTEELVSATGPLPILLHYALSLLGYFGLAAAPVLMPLYTGGWLAFQRRLRCAGRGCGAPFAGGVTVGALALLVLLASGLLPCALGLGGKIRPLALAAAAVLMAAFCSLFAALCCLAAKSAAGCGAAAFGLSLAWLFLAGGVIPPVLLPGGVRRLSALSPVTWLRQLAAWPMGYPVPAGTWACLALSAAGMAAAGLALYRKRVDREGTAP